MKNKNKIFVLNIDTVKNKNLNQFDAMYSFGYFFYVFGYQCSKIAETPKSYLYYKYPSLILKRMLFVFSMLFNNRKDIHHVELYTGGGSFLGLEYLICRILRLKICVVERGSPLKDLEFHYSWLGRLIRKLIYRRTDYIWIREIWMIDALKNLGRSDYFFLSNAILVPNTFNHDKCKSIDFIWCNSFKKWRNADWFVKSFSRKYFNNCSAVMLGLLQGNASVESVQNIVLENTTNNLKVLPFQDPRSYLIQSKFFILPADIVFLNFSLLEAMSYGVVPIISDVQGAREIIDDGYDGYIIKHDIESLYLTMKKVLDLPAIEYELMSKRAREKVKSKFSIEAWSKSLAFFYETMK